MNFYSQKMIKGCRYSNNKCNSTNDEIIDMECIFEDNDCYTLEEHSRKTLEIQKQSTNPFRTSSRPPPPPPPRTTINSSRPPPPPPKSSFRAPLPPGPRPQKISGINVYTLMLNMDYIDPHSNHSIHSQ
jgi:hypothetical protein